MDASQLRTTVRRTLEAWPAFPAIADLLRRYQDLEIYLAGGVIRDAILQRADDPKDFDLFLGGSGIDEALDDLRSVGTLVVGPFGSPRWIPSQVGVPPADVIPIARFDNGLWACEDMVDALNQFDFTGNAVAFDLRTWQFYDPQNGSRDLRRGALRAVRFDYPDEPIGERTGLTRLAVLWFRLLHYAASRSLEVEPVTRRWLTRNRRSGAERVAFETAFFPLHDDVAAVLEGALLPRVRR